MFSIASAAHAAGALAGMVFVVLLVLAAGVWLVRRASR
jgi:hypothetical protein